MRLPDIGNGIEMLNKNNLKMQHISSKSPVGLFDLLMVLLSMYVVVVLMITYVIGVPMSDEMSDLLNIIDNAVCCIFAIDFILKITAYKIVITSKRRVLVLLFKEHLILDLLACIPIFNTSNAIYVMIGRFFRGFKFLSSINLLFRLYDTAKVEDEITNEEVTGGSRINRLAKKIVGYVYKIDTPFDVIILFLSVYVLVIFAISEMINLPDDVSKRILIIDWIICILFAIDFVCNLIRQGNKKKRIKYLLSWGLIDLIACIPSAGFLQSCKLTKTFKILRLLKVGKEFVVLFKHNKAKDTAISVLFISLIFVIFSSIFILIAERDVGGNIKTASDALWWTLETFTGSADQDLVPVSPEARIIAMLLRVCDTVVISSFAGVFASYFVTKSKK